MKSRFIAVFILVACIGASSASAESMTDVSRGELIFRNHCSNCHDNSAHMLNDNGPALFGVVGRGVGSVEGFAYTPILQQANARGEQWTVSRLDKFLKQPELMYGGTGMPMNFDRERDRKSIIAYLSTLHTH